MGTKLISGCSKYGADMGRRSKHADDQTAPLKFRLECICHPSQAYDNGGAYWGQGSTYAGAPHCGGVWMARADLPDEAPGRYDVEWYFRATDRDDAKAKVLAEYPKARFYR